jgi:2-succinyl-5-enolpyruvyl-6-hydroxy-3-cyclohexene-1-carboxylate synthase
VVNNGDGAEFILYHHYDDCFGEEVEKYIAAGGHYGRKSKSLVKHYAEDLGFKYISASNKDEFRKVSPEFMSTEKTCPILFEVFTDSQDESAALFEIDHLTNLSTKTVLKDSLKKSVRTIVGQKGIETIKGIINH